MAKLPFLIRRPRSFLASTTLTLVWQSYLSPELQNLLGSGYDVEVALPSGQTGFTGVWTQEVDPMNMAILRDPAPDASQWTAIYTAADERLATWDLSLGGEPVQHWTLRSPSGQILRDFLYTPPFVGEPIFCERNNLTLTFLA